MKNQTIAPRRYGEECDGCTGPEQIDVMRFQRAIRAITGKWKIEIVCSLVAGPMRFGELRRALPGITQHMLTEQLRDLERNGIVIRTAYAEIPPRVEYALSQAGIDLMPTFATLRDWALRYENQLADQS
ncbi:winged helix-turn-helix transcriptional regulator [Rhizobium leguminosarum]|uniref:winged helix-turn-helix transcriptional regulator n=1 Tax=Rhizobium leguminosarum TaxID=384 RepID=UPI0024A7E288|nr:helix-turn-helix domain-containing protein [Rhizobium leguminosarum]MDI5929226.1 helix-turn-helix domain-containing protein [Rhizobium leguminosarum]